MIEVRFDGDIVKEKSGFAFTMRWPLFSGSFAAIGLVIGGFDLGLCKNSSSFPNHFSGSDGFWFLLYDSCVLTLQFGDCSDLAFWVSDFHLLDSREWQPFHDDCRSFASGVAGGCCRGVAAASRGIPECYVWLGRLGWSGWANGLVWTWTWVGVKKSNFKYAPWPGFGEPESPALVRRPGFSELESPALVHRPSFGELKSPHWCVGPILVNRKVLRCFAAIGLVIGGFDLGLCKNSSSFPNHFSGSDGFWFLLYDSCVLTLQFGDCSDLAFWVSDFHLLDSREWQPFHDDCRSFASGVAGGCCRGVAVASRGIPECYVWLGRLGWSGWASGLVWTWTWVGLIDSGPSLNKIIKNKIIIRVV
ncbi:hypothetical protein V8G54_001967 [Vigna mungo]|uniref:Uncharacterized protein n=1 Tax=Vigna mungo TaxID=3915 RepID=A0AAQ3PBD8_VIGMU